MDVLLHDFSGHPFQAELARRLAGRGHRVTHLSSAEYVSGKGHLQARPEDSDSLSFETIELGRPFDKYSVGRRVRWELDYGAAASRTLDRHFDAVIMCNVPLFSLARFVREARRRDVPWLFWHQDVYSAGMAEELRRRLPAPAAVAAARSLDRLERHCARRASQVVAIGDLFTDVYRRWQVDLDRVSVIPNWAPLDEIVVAERENPQAKLLFPGDETALRLLYAGTLGRKHNPQLLVDLLRRTRASGVNAVLTVVSEGEAADDLRAAAAADPDLPLQVFGFQPAEALTDTLASADVLVGLLEVEASAFSIPSKMLTYMAAGRPILGLMPPANPAAVDAVSCGGFAVDPTPDGVDQAVRWLGKVAGNPGERVEIGRRMRALAEDRFDPSRITEQFESALRRMVGHR